jgi:hypothetical protein
VEIYIKAQHALGVDETWALGPLLRMAIRVRRCAAKRHKSTSNKFIGILSSVSVQASVLCWNLVVVPRFLLEFHCSRFPVRVVSSRLYSNYVSGCSQFLAGCSQSLLTHGVHYLFRMVRFDSFVGCAELRQSRQRAASDDVSVSHVPLKCSLYRSNPSVLTNERGDL